MLKVSAGGMSFRFIEHKVPEGEKVECPKICPIADICERLPDPRNIKDSTHEFYELCTELESDGFIDMIPDMTEAEVLEEYKKVGIGLSEETKIGED